MVRHVSDLVITSRQADTPGMVRSPTGQVSMQAILRVRLEIVVWYKIYSSARLSGRSHSPIFESCPIAIFLYVSDRV